MISSLLRRAVFQPLYFWVVRSPRLSYLRDAEIRQTWSHEELQTLQGQRFSRLVQHLWSRNGFYRRRFREHGLRDGEDVPVSEIGRIPILEKAEIAPDPKAVISEGYLPGDLMEMRTGGSTGRALTIFISEYLSEVRNGVAWRSDQWSGWKRGEPIAAVWGNPRRPSGWKQTTVDSLVQPHVYLDTMEVNDRAVREFVASCLRFSPSLLFGHAHSLYVLSQELKRGGFRLPTIRSIISTSMMLLPHERALIEDVFGMKVTDRYGCEEVGLISCECETHEGMHINSDHVLVEFLRSDGQPASPGEPGEIVVTDLVNTIMPFVRYRLMDVASSRAGSCACGRGFPMMNSVIGRTADFLLKPDGTRVAGVSLIENTLTAIEGIEQMQIIQEEVHAILAKIVLRADNDRAVSELRSRFAGIFGDTVRIDVERVNAIEAEPSGKFRFSINRVGQDRQDG